MIGAINNYLYLCYRTQIWNIMDDFNTVYALLVLVMLFILLSRLDNRFGKIEKELNEIRNGWKIISGFSKILLLKPPSRKRKYQKKKQKIFL